jgi:hypothetical protein
MDDYAPFLYDATTGAFTELNRAIPPFTATLTAPQGIDDAGRILANGIPDGENIAAVFLLTPVFDALALGEMRPGVAGQANAIGAAGAVPGAFVRLAASAASGATNVPGCPGLVLGLASPFPAGAAIADGYGQVSFTGLDVPASFAGRTALLQAVEFLSCRTSNVRIAAFP